MRFVGTWLLLAGLWLGLSGHFDPIHLTLGFISVTLVSVLSARHLVERGAFGRGLASLLRLGLYLPWLLGQVVMANVDVLLRVLGIRPVRPRLLRIDPGLHTDFGRVALANSITLTPGTVTVLVEDGTFLVHAIGPEAAAGIESRRMIDRVRRIEGSAS